MLMNIFLNLFSFTSYIPNFIMFIKTMSSFLVWLVTEVDLRWDIPQEYLML